MANIWIDALWFSETDIWVVIENIALTEKYVFGELREKEQEVRMCDRLQITLYTSAKQAANSPYSIPSTTAFT